MKSISFLIINTIVSIGTIETLPALVQTVHGYSFSAWRGVAIRSNRVQKAQSEHLVRPPHQCHTEGMSDNEEHLPDASQAKKRAHENAEDQGQNEARKERKMEFSTVDFFNYLEIKYDDMYRYKSSDNVSWSLFTWTAGLRV